MNLPPEIINKIICFINSYYYPILYHIFFSDFLNSPPHINQLNDLLCWAAKNRNKKLCYLAKKWGANDFVSMLYAATQIGSKQICCLAKKWKEQKKEKNIDKEQEQSNNYKQSIKKQKKIFDKMLLIATQNNYEHLCHLAKEWGATDFDRMLYKAAEYNHEHLCYLAKEWGATDSAVSMMLGVAASNENEQLCRLAKEWGANRFDIMLSEVAARGNKHLCYLAREWGANSINDFNWMIEAAARGGHEELCYLAKEWGATNFVGMLCVADLFKRKKLVALARKWINENKS